MDIVVYRITGAQGFMTVPDWVCPECDLTVTAVQAACLEANVLVDRVSVRPWVTHLREAWRAGAHHPPAVVVNGILYSQEIVPEVPALAAYLQRIHTDELRKEEGVHES